jgi:hypothetical protein
MNIVAIYGSGRCVEYTQRLLEDIRIQVQATGLPSIIVGDFNWDVDECRQWMSGCKWHMWGQDFGRTCTTAEKVSSIDYMPISPQLRGAIISSASLNSKLATHGPVRIGLAVKRDVEVRVFEAPTKSRPQNTPVIGPHMEDTSNASQWSIWKAQAKALERSVAEQGKDKLPAEALNKAVQWQWDEWQKLVGPEAKAKFGFSHECGREHSFNWKSTRDIVEDSKPHTCQQSGIHTWILRKIQELIAFERQVGAQRISTNRKEESEPS